MDVGEGGGADEVSLFEGMEFVNPVLLDLTPSEETEPTGESPLTVQTLDLPNSETTLQDTAPEKNVIEVESGDRSSPILMTKDPVKLQEGNGINRNGKSGSNMRHELDEKLFSALQVVSTEPVDNAVQEVLDASGSEFAATSAMAGAERIVRKEDTQSVHGFRDKLTKTADGAPVVPVVRKKKRIIRVGYEREQEEERRPETEAVVGLVASDYRFDIEGPSHPAPVVVPTGGVDNDAAMSAGGFPEGRTVASSSSQDREHSGEAGISRSGCQETGSPAEEDTHSEDRSPDVLRDEHSNQEFEHGAAEETAVSEGRLLVGGTEEEQQLRSKDVIASRLEGEDQTPGIGAKEGTDAGEGSGAMRLKRRAAGVRAELNASVGQIQKDLKDVAVARKAAVQRRRDAAGRLARALRQLQELEAEVAAACEREDFEAADSLSQQAENLQTEVDSARTALGVAEEESEKLLAQLQSLVHLGIEAEARAADQLAAAQQEAVDLVGECKGRAEQQAKMELETIQAEEEAVEARRRKLAVERRVMEEESAELATRLDGLTSGEREERARLMAERGRLEGELQDLLALVRRKEGEITAQDALVAAVDGRIAAVASKFEKVRAGLEEEKHRVELATKEVEEEEERIGERRRGLEAGVAAAEAEARELESAMAELAGDVTVMREGVRRRQAEAEAGVSARQRMRELAEEEKDLAKDAAEILSDAAFMRAAQKDLADRLLRLQQDAASIQQRLAVADRRIPELEAEKKLAAASRNFKEAARLAAEAKLLSNDRAAAMEEQKAVAAATRSAEAEAEMSAAQLSEVEAMAAEKRVGAAMARCRRLRLEAAALRREMESAAEGEDFEEAECLRVEAESADAEADDLCGLHSLSGGEFERVGQDGECEHPATPEEGAAVETA